MIRTIEVCDVCQTATSQGVEPVYALGDDMHVCRQCLADYVVGELKGSDPKRCHGLLMRMRCGMAECQTASAPSEETI